MTITQNIRLDIENVTRYRCSITAKQNDNGTRRFCATLTQQGKVYQIPGGVTAKVRCAKPDGHYCQNPAEVNTESGTVTFTLTEQMLACPGQVLADIALMIGDQLLSTATFTILVEQIPGGDEKVSSNEFLELEHAVRDSKAAMQAAIQKAAAAEAAARRAESAAQAAETMIDDTVIATEKTHSSNHIYELACATISETAPVVSCYPVEGYPLGVVSHIAPLQGGSGNPSPTNVRPIFPVTACKTVVCGKNLAGDITVQNSFRQFNSLLKADANLLRQGQTVTISFDTPNTGIECYIDPYCGLPQSQIFMDGKRHRVSGVIRDSQKIIAGCVSVLSRMTPSSDVGTGIISNVQIELGSSETSYETYRENVYTVRLPAGTYGGEVEWNHRKVISTKVRYVCTGAEEVILEGTGRIAITNLPKIFQREQTAAVCSHFSNVSTKYENVIYCEDTGLSAEAFKKVLKDAAATDCPVTIVSASKEVRKADIIPTGLPVAIPGLNNIYSDAGDTTVVAPENPNYTTKKLMDRIAAVEAAVLK